MKKVNIAIVGSGFAASIHCEAYRKVRGVDVVVKAIASTGKTVKAFADKFGIKDIYADYKEMLKDEEIDIVDICTPVCLHEKMVVEVIKAGKNVICEKPFTGYFGEVNDEKPIGKKVSKVKMMKKVLENMEETKKVIEKSGKLFMYAENWIYSPTILKCAEILNAKKSKILFMKGEESHSGSHAVHAANWEKTGGGAMIRMGCHPLSAVLYLKKVEALARGEKIDIKSIIADTGYITDTLPEGERKYLAARPVDVEDWANITVTFSDGTKASITAGDMIVGGVKNYIELYNNDSALVCNITPNNNMLSYFIDKSNTDNIYLTEKVETKEGWQFVCTSEELVRGYIDELQDFTECVAYERTPLSDFDLAYDTIKVIYSGYLSAEEGRRIDY